MMGFSRSERRQGERLTAEEEKDIARKIRAAENAAKEAIEGLEVQPGPDAQREPPGVQADFSAMLSTLSGGRRASELSCSL